MRHVPKQYSNAPSHELITVALWTRGREQAAALAELEARGLQLSPQQQLTAGLRRPRSGRKMRRPSGVSSETSKANNK